ncbi:MAG: hypothetical protein JNK74_12400 [Candidatus Hydrogenedentes bacterium]|nr:hypothetical protein [Candidatus Hydrogenedentota bacterium]
MIRSLFCSFLFAAVTCADTTEPGRAVNGNPANEVFLSNADLSGWLLDNEGNAKRDGGGFNLLSHRLCPDMSIYRAKQVGLNFEHIFNGAATDAAISMFTPRVEPNVLLKQDGKQASLHWPAASSSWGVDCTMTYTFVEPDAIDMTFSATPTRESWPQGYLAFMWASYMARTVERPIHFWGTTGGEESWLQFGEATSDAQGFETGTVAAKGVAPLPYEAESKSLNIIEHPAKHFVLPFYFGLIDGDHDLATKDDTLAYILMFNQIEPMRFALWNFIKDESGKPDPHSPAWDWQYVIREPKVGQTYGYKMRVVVTLFTSREDVLARYSAWADAH